MCQSRLASPDKPSNLKHSLQCNCQSKFQATWKSNRLLNLSTPSNTQLLDFQTTQNNRNKAGQLCQSKLASPEKQRTKQDPLEPFKKNEDKVGWHPPTNRELSKTRWKLFKHIKMLEIKQVNCVRAGLHPLTSRERSKTRWIF